MPSLGETSNRLQRGKIIAKKQLSSQCFELTLALDKPMVFIPGQYVWINITHPAIQDVKGTRRAFSITSTPSNPTAIKIIGKQTNSEFKKALLGFNIGDELEVIGPFGFSYRLPDDPLIPLLFIAKGSGISPFLSIIRSLSEGSAMREIALVNVASVNDKPLFEEELNQIAAKNPKLRVVNVNKSIDFEQIEKSCNLDHAQVYVCGSQEFVDLIHEQLKIRKVFDHQVHFEQFYPTANLASDLSIVFKDGEPNVDIQESSQLKKQLDLVYKLVQSSTNHTIVTDLNGNIIYANQAAQDITGYSLKEMLGNTPRLWGGLMSKQFYQSLWKAKNEGQSFNTEVINHRKNHELYVASAHISPIKGTSGQILGFIATEEDITKIRNAEEQLNNERQRLDYIVRGTNLGTWEWNVQTGETIFNERWAEIIGYTLAELEPINIQTWERFAHPDDLKKSDIELEKHFKKESEFYIFESRMRHKSGKWIWVLDRGKVTSWTTDGKPLWMYGSHLDITDRKEEEQRYISLVNNVDGVVYRCKNDPDWTMYFISEEIERLTGYSPQDFINNQARTFSSIIHEEDQARVQKTIQEALDLKKSYTLEYRLHHKENHWVWVKEKGHGVFDNEGNLLWLDGLIFNNQKEHDIDKAKSEFISLASHQLRTPLTTIKWYIEMLLAGDAGKLNPEQQKFLKEAYEGGHRLSELVASLLDISRIEMGTYMIEHKAIDANQIAENVIKELTSATEEKKLKVIFVKQTVPTIIFDPHLLTIILQNLLTNAVRYSKPQGSITLSINATSQENKEPALNIQVSDNGIGIPKESQNKIFSKLYRADNAKKQESNGTGLGLYMVKELVERCHGKIWFDSLESTGTNFYVTLPYNKA